MPVSRLWWPVARLQFTVDVRSFLKSENAHAHVDVEKACFCSVTFLSGELSLFCGMYS